MKIDYFGVGKRHCRVLLNYCRVLLNYCRVLLNYCRVLLNYCRVLLNYCRVLRYLTQLTKNFLMVQAPGFIRGINPKLRSIASCAWQPLKSSSPRIDPWGESKI
jgi:hypothetical protein